MKNHLAFRPGTVAFAVACGLVTLLPSWGAGLRFAVVGDSQLTFDNPLAEPKILLSFIKDMSAQDPRPALLLHTGDIITGWTSSASVLRKQYDVFREAARAAPFPINNAIGNHEGYTRESIAIFRKEFGPTWRSFDSDGWHFVLLDDASEEHYAALGAAQEAWLAKDLEANRSKKGTFIAFHLPLVADEMEGWLEVDKSERDRLHALFRANNVKAVFQGHVHTYEMCVRDGVRYVISGGGGGPLENWPPIGCSYHYLVVDADEGNLSIAPRRLEDIEGEAKDRSAPTPAPVAAPPGSLLEGFEEAASSRWSLYNDLVKISPEEEKATEGRRSLKVDFDFAVSLWPILMRDSATPWDMSSAGGVAVDVWASPELYAAKGETPKLGAGVEKLRSQPRELVRGKWSTIRWDFGDATWEKGDKEQALAPDDLKSVLGFSLHVVSDTAEPRKGWDYRMKGYILVDNLRTY